MLRLLFGLLCGDEQTQIPLPLNVRVVPEGDIRTISGTRASRTKTMAETNSVLRGRKSTAVDSGQVFDLTDGWLDYPKAQNSQPPGLG